MPSRSRSVNFDFSIKGDELEHNRIRLERTLQHTDISLHLSSAPEDDDCSDVEYPRHNSGPAPFDGFTSFDHHSRDHYDLADDHSHPNAWSYRTMDDEGVNPYEGRTVSTAAHHASALTLSAGLGGRGSRRDISLSGAEYDPDRPLHGIIAGFGTHIPGLDGDSTRSRPYISTVDFDPLVVDDSAEVEKVFLGNRGSISVPAPRSSSSASGSSRPATPLSPRPKLSDALHQVAFSPKRPRSGQVQTIKQGSARPQTSLARHLPPTSKKPHGTAMTTITDEDDVPTPKSRSKSNTSLSRIYQQSLSYAAPIEPEVNVLPPTPPSEENTSKFTRLARGLAKEIEDEQSRQSTTEGKPAYAQSTLREKHSRTDSNKVPLRSVLSDLQDPRVQGPARTAGARTPLKGKVYLPDMTGLTSVVTSPAKFGPDYLGYESKSDNELDVRLATTLNIVQSKLAHLESENSISRRRVRELELELEDCKRQVARERTKVLKRELVLTEQHSSREAKLATQSAHAKSGGPSRLYEVATEVDRDDPELSRYKEAVEEKKALEALISSLRGHLSRLTSELSDHHRLLQELRNLRDSDVRALKDKSRDIDQLRQEVERLGGEVEVLRGVVEEGLKERREVRELSRELSQSSGSVQVEDHVESDDETEQAVDHPNEEQPQSDSEDELSGRSTPSPRPSPMRNRKDDKTIRTDQATLGSLPLENSTMQPPITMEEYDRIVQEVVERRSERSVSGTASGSHRSSSRASLRGPSSIQSISSSHSQHSFSRRGAGAERDNAEFSTDAAAPADPAGCPSPYRELHIQQDHAGWRPSRDPTNRQRDPRSSNGAPGPSSRAEFKGRASPNEAAFPEIRGEYLEQLFFSAPEHNANTCTVCHRRTRARGGRNYMTANRRRSSWGDAPIPHDTEIDEGFAEGSEDAQTGSATHRGKGKRRAAQDQDEQVPPQTVLGRVLRELEDDFTHYKSIYIELADQYKIIDAVSNVAKRNVLAEHLREVIDILEQKGDQIASLYDLLTFKDKPLRESVVPEMADDSVWSTAPQAGASTREGVHARRR
ncbi:hypothetical protein BDW22DRAFT_1353291 [Trametopsis cervina]|nr:hypothetical protein BDW22DRAFT_1353291 [Trametopsis cervina]